MDCSGYIFYGCLYADESLRGKQFGTQLMSAAEKLAYDNHCHFVAVNTMDFEALEFYKKCGFTVEFVRENKVNPQFTKTFFAKSIPNTLISLIGPSIFSNVIQHHSGSFRSRLKWQGPYYYLTLVLLCRPGI